MKFNMEEVKDLIKKERPKLKQISINQYYSHLKKLQNLFDTDNFDFLEKPEDVKNKIKNNHFTSIRNSYNAIIVFLLALNDKNEYNDLIEKYTKLRDELNQKYEDEQKSGVISEKQKNNFATMEEINNMLIELRSEVMPLKKKKNLTKMDIATLRAWILFNMLIRIPTRNDASNMQFITQTNYKRLSEENKKENNYLVNERNNMKFIYNQYKTSKKYGELVVPVPSDLKPMLRLYIRLMNYKVGDNIFPLSKNAISQLLLKHSKRILNKAISSTMIRKIYLSEKYAKVKEEQIKDAKIMGHSVATQQKVYTKEKE